MKTVFKLLIIIIMLPVAFFSIKYYKRPVMITPVPYINKISLKNSEQKNIEASDVLIVGDRMAMAIKNYTSTIMSELPRELSKSVKIYNWSTKYEFIGKTLSKLKKLKKLPKVIVYHGASTEFYEKRFSIEDRDIIFKNLEKYKNDSIISAILTWPYISKFIYGPMTTYLLSNKVKNDTREYSSREKLKKYELVYKLYEVELDRLIAHVRAKGSTIILTTTPVNLDTAPFETCDHSLTSKILNQQKNIEGKLIKNHSLKMTYNQIKNLASKTISNARSFYLYGQAARKMGKFQKARLILSLASVYDCEQWRSNMVFNSIIKNRAFLNENEIYLIDFDEIVNSQYGHNVLFLNKIYPQNIFYKRFSKDIASIISRVFAI